jgi:HEAT repeat protein
MLRVLLCGASDIDRVSQSFARVVGAFGGEAWQFLDGRINYLNSATATWEQNSAATVRAADLVVFAIVERHGRISWDVELVEALDAGKPLLILCLSSTYNRYQTLRGALHDDLSALEDNDLRRVVEQLRSLEVDRQLTIAQFESESFGACLRQQMSTLFVRGLHGIEQRQARAAVARLLEAPDELRGADWPQIVRIALDEFELKQLRKRALHALAVGGPGLEDDEIISLISSPEQGVQRTAIANLSQLVRGRPVDPELIAEIVALVSASDDIGLLRRAIPALLDASARVAVGELARMDLTQAGVRRRIAEALVARQAGLVDLDAAARRDAITLLTLCVEDAAPDPGWKPAARSLILALAGEAPVPD